MYKANERPAMGTTERAAMLAPRYAVIATFMRAPRPPAKSAIRRL